MLWSSKLSRPILAAATRTSSVAFQPSQYVLSKRFINLQEYQSKQLMEQNNIGIQRFKVVEKIEEVKTILADKKLAEAKEYVIKAQVLAGGRGKGHFRNSGFKGGVRLTREKGEVEGIVRAMLGDYLITAQTPKEGIQVHKVMVAEAIDIKKELYLAILLDRSSNGPVIVASPEGGMDIEQVAERTPEAVHKFPVPIDRNAQELEPKLAMKIAGEGLGLSGKLQEDAAKEIGYLYKMVSFVYIFFCNFEMTHIGSISPPPVPQAGRPPSGDQPPRHHLRQLRRLLRREDELRRERHVPPRVDEPDSGGECR